MRTAMMEMMIIMRTSDMKCSIFEVKYQAQKRISNQSFPVIKIFSKSLFCTQPTKTGDDQKKSVLLLTTKAFLVLHSLALHCVSIPMLTQCWQNSWVHCNTMVHHEGNITQLWETDDAMHPSELMLKTAVDIWHDDDIDVDTLGRAALKIISV